MKKSIIIGLLLVLSSCYNRIGDLTIIANRNVESKANYKLLQRGVTVTVKSKKGDPLERAVDKAVEKAKGEFLKNAAIYVKTNGKKIKITGDVWGIPSVQSQLTKMVKATIQFEVGDKVSYKAAFGVIKEGVILGLNQDTAIISCKNGFGKEVKKEMAYSELTKLGE